MDRKKLIDPILIIVLIVALLAPRLPSLGSFSTLDEPYWLSMGANFYYALGQREFQNTVYEYQPAVTTMWIVTAAMLVYFPEYRGMGQGYLDYNKGGLDPFMLVHGKDPLKLLEISRVIQVLLITALFLVLFFLLKRFVPKYVAAFAVIFASLDPFFLSQSRLLDHEAMLSLFVMLSVLALALYLSQGHRLIFLILSGVSAGLAQLTKSSAIAILAPVGVLFLIQVYRERAEGLLKVLIKNFMIFIFWLMLLVIAYFAFWPGMWVVPQKMLYEVYGNAFSYAFQGARLSAAGELESSRFNLNLNIAGILSLAETILRRTTPLTWLGILFGFSLPFTHDPEWIGVRRQLFTSFSITALAFVVMFGIAQGRNSPHYILCSYLALNLLAGLGWFHIIRILVAHFATLTAQRIQYTVLSIFLFLQFWSAIAFFPYYFTYQNPILYQYKRNENFPLFPYGEGLELAAQYLAGLPNAKESTALVYYSRGCFSYFYPGMTTSFRPYFVDGRHAQDLIHSIRSSDYVVVYYAVQGGIPSYKGYTEALSEVNPIHEVWLDGRKYVIIYQVDQIPERVLEVLANLKPVP
jgi:4-amino-4-deoxy-L-arabinose transferase-like glycosyltransferase